MLTIAIAKGRLQEPTLELLARADIRFAAGDLGSRRLTVYDETGNYQVIFVKPADVPVYVEHGIADCGVVGSDVLAESNADLLWPLDLGFARCKLVVATANGKSLTDAGMLRVGTKYPSVAAAHFGERGIPAEIIGLVGSVELAPVLGLADCIVDVIETGRTLKENGLSVVDEIFESTARLVVNRACYQLKSTEVSGFIQVLNSVLAATPANQK